MQIEVDTGGYTGLWLIQGATGFRSGDQTVSVEPGIHRVRAGVAGAFLIDVAGDGTVTSLNLDAATGFGDMLTFENTTISVDPGSFAGFWDIQFVSGAFGPVQIIVVPSARYRFIVSGQNQDFSVAGLCAIDPTQFDLAGSTFNITCGAPDSDGDGAPDDTDNCPAIANPDQVDQDLDGPGNLCDMDLDGDGFANIGDNCPDLANPFQDDLDGNGEGDLCDGDQDGDTVANEFDQCPQSPLGQLVNLDGCTGAQFIAVSCQRESFVQHGQYVSCVAHTANDAVDEGLMSPMEKARFVKEAAKKPAP